MPNRILREGILTSPRMAKLGWAEEVFYRRLMSVVDDFGRYFADSGLLLAACYPRQLKKVSDSDIGKWLAACESAALVRVYPAQDGERYLQLLDFGQQVRAKKSKFPDPLSTCAADAKQPPADAHLGVSVFESVSESGDSAAPSAPPAFTLPLVDKTEHPITQAEVDEWASAYPAVNVPQQLREMRAWCMANPTQRKTARGVNAFIVRWLSREQDKGGGSAPRQDISRVTVPGTNERDPALRKIEEDAKKAAPIPAHVRAQIDAALKGKVH